MCSDIQPQDILIKEKKNIRIQLAALQAAEVEYKKLKRKVEYFSLLSNEILCIIKTDGSFTYLNYAAEKILGFTQDELLLKSFVSLIHPNEKKFIIKELQKLSTGLPIVSFSCRCLNKNGIFSRLVWTLTYIAEDDVFYGVAQDITSFKKEKGIINFTMISDQRGDGQNCCDMGVSASLINPVEKADLYQKTIKTLEGHSENYNKNKPLFIPHSVRTDCHRLSILLTEDDINSQKLSISMLEKRGHFVVVAKNGQETLQILNKIVFDLIIISFNLPDMQGLDLAAIIRGKEQSEGYHIPIIILKEKKNKLLIPVNSSIDGTLLKPINIQEMYEIVDRIIVERMERDKKDSNEEDIFDGEFSDDFSENIQCALIEKIPYLTYDCSGDSKNEKEKNRFFQTIQ